jgi:hypothetical protein
MAMIRLFPGILPSAGRQILPPASHVRRNNEERLPTQFHFISMCYKIQASLARQMHSTQTVKDLLTERGHDQPTVKRPKEDRQVFHS